MIKNSTGLIRSAEMGNPQIIRRPDTEASVVISIEDRKKLNGKRLSLAEFLQRSPLNEIIPYLQRSEDLPREVSFE